MFYFSLVLVGGDGFYHEAVNSLERRAMDEEGFDKDVADISLRQISLPIGIIPAGNFIFVGTLLNNCKNVQAKDAHVYYTLLISTIVRPDIPFGILC